LDVLMISLVYQPILVFDCGQSGLQLIAQYCWRIDLGLFRVSSL
jgi:hypothetical protein